MKQPGFWPGVAVGAIGAVLIMAVGASVKNKPPAADSAPKFNLAAVPPTQLDMTNTPVQVTPSDAPLAPPTNSAWSYNETKDEMRGSSIRTLCVDSTEIVHLESPYESQYPRLCIRRHPKFGLDAYIVLPSGGQFICRSYDGCTVSAKFGDGPAQAFSANEADDGSSNVLFIANASRFLAGLRKVDRVRVEAQFYEAGNQQMLFPVEGHDETKAELAGGGTKGG